jgi:hypothetical protein
MAKRRHDMTDDPSGWLWFLINFVAVAILAIGLIYGTISWHHRRKDAKTRLEREKAVRQNYRRGG